MQQAASQMRSMCLKSIMAAFVTKRNRLFLLTKRYRAGECMFLESFPIFILITLPAQMCVLARHPENLMSGVHQENRGSADNVLTHDEAKMKSIATRN